MIHISEQGLNETQIENIKKNLGVVSPSKMMRDSWVDDSSTMERTIEQNKDPPISIDLLPQAIRDEVMQKISNQSRPEFMSQRLNTRNLPIYSCNPDKSAIVEAIKKYHEENDPVRDYMDAVTYFAGFENFCKTNFSELSNYIFDIIKKVCAQEHFEELKNSFIVKIRSPDYVCYKIHCSMKLKYDGPKYGYSSSEVFFDLDMQNLGLTYGEVRQITNIVTSLIHGYQKYVLEKIIKEELTPVYKDGYAYVNITADGLIDFLNSYQIDDSGTSSEKAWSSSYVRADHAHPIDTAKKENDILKGENEMAKTEAQIRYEEKCNEAKKAYDEALRVAREELDAAEQRKKCDNAASMMRDLYDSYILAGFSEEQAMKFVTIALEKGK